MKIASPQLTALINGSNTFRCVDFYEITLNATEGPNLLSAPFGPFLSAPWSPTVFTGDSISEVHGNPDPVNGLTASQLTVTGPNAVVSGSIPDVYGFTQTVSLVKGKTYRLRIYLKLGTLPPPGDGFGDSGFDFGGIMQWLNPTPGSVSGQVYGGIGLPLANTVATLPDIFNFPNGWYSFQSDFVAEATSGYPVTFRVPPDSASAFTGQTIFVAFPYIGEFPAAVLRYVDADMPITFGGELYTTEVGFHRSGVRWSALPQVDSLDVELFTRKDVLYGGIPLAQGAMNGLFDDARLLIRRGFFNPSGVMVDALVHFEGHVAAVAPSADIIKLTVKSELERLNIQVPFNTFMPNCAHAFLDQGCDPNPPGTLRASVTTTGVVLGAGAFNVPLGATIATDVWFAGTFGFNFYQLGVILFTSGPCSGLRRGIRTDFDAGGQHFLTLAVPLPIQPLPGDTFRLIQGCARTVAACAAHNNLPRFRGFPWVPQPESVI